MSEASHLSNNNETFVWCSLALANTYPGLHWSTLVHTVCG